MIGPIITCAPVDHVDVIMKAQIIQIGNSQGYVFQGDARGNPTFRGGRAGGASGRASIKVCKSPQHLGCRVQGDG